MQFVIFNNSVGKVQLILNCHSKNVHVLTTIVTYFLAHTLQLKVVGWPIEICFYDCKSLMLKFSMD